MPFNDQAWLDLGETAEILRNRYIPFKAGGLIIQDDLASEVSRWAKEGH